MSILLYHNPAYASQIQETVLVFKELTIYFRRINCVKDSEEFGGILHIPTLLNN